MSNQEWDALAAQWDGMEVGDPALLQRRLRRHVRWKRIGLFGEVFGLLSALGVIALAWSRAIELRDLLVAIAVVLVLSQGIHLMLRHRYRLFGAPDGGLVGLIDAEIRRAQFVIAAHCAGVGIGVLILSLAWALIPADGYPLAVDGLIGGLVAGGLSLAYMALRSWQMLRRIRRLREERTSLAE